jgi:hypothetical protein
MKFYLHSTSTPQLRDVHVPFVLNNATKVEMQLLPFPKLACITALMMPEG